MPGVPGIDGRVNDTLTLTPTCSNLLDMSIAANYILLPIDTVKTDTIPNGDSVIIYSVAGAQIRGYAGTISGHSGSNSFPTRGNSTIIIKARPGSGQLFDHWRSNNSYINGLVSPRIYVNVNGGIWLTPVFDPIIPLSGSYDLALEVTGNDDPGGLDLSTTSIEINYPVPPGVGYNFYPSVGTSCTYPTIPPHQLSIPTVSYGGSDYFPTAAAYQDVGLFETEVNGPPLGVYPTGDPCGPGITYNYNAGDILHTEVWNVGTTHDTSLALTDWTTYIDYHVRRFPVYFDVEIAMVDSLHEAPPSNLEFQFGNTSNQTNTIGVYLTATNTYESSNPSESPNSNVPHQWDGSSYYHFEEDLSYEAGVDITMGGATGDAYTLVEWITNVSTDNGAHWTTYTGATNQLNWYETQIHGPGTRIVAKAIFQRNFTLRSIAVWQDPNYNATGRSYTLAVPGSGPNDIGTVDGTWGNFSNEIMLKGSSIADVEWGSSVYYPTLQLTFNFSDAIDPSTLWGNILCSEQKKSPMYFPHGPLDLNMPALTFLIDGSPAIHPWFILSNGDSTLTWYVSSLGGVEYTSLAYVGGDLGAFISASLLRGEFGSGFIIPSGKLDEYAIQLTSGLKSIHGAALTNWTTTLTGEGSDAGYLAQTVNPDVSWTVTNTALNDFDNSDYVNVWPFGEINVGNNLDANAYLVTTCSYKDESGASAPMTPAQSQKTSEVLLGTGNSHNFNVSIVDGYSRPRDNSAIEGTVTTMNAENYTIYNNLSSSGLSLLVTVFTAFATGQLEVALPALVGAVQPSATQETQEETSIENSAISKATSTIFGLTSSSSSDDEKMASNAWTGVMENWWGALGPLSKNSPGQYTPHNDNMGNTTSTLTITLQ